MYLKSIDHKSRKKANIMYKMLNNFSEEMIFVCYNTAALNNFTKSLTHFKLIGYLNKEIV